MRTQCMIRVRWERAGQFKAVSMDLRDRKDASSASSAEAAVRACATKVLTCAPHEVCIITPSRPNKRLEEVVTTAGNGDWAAFECCLKGTATQVELLPGGAS